MPVNYLDTSRSCEERAKDLVARMTLEERVSQMLYNAPAVERLGIPEYNWWNEALHGVARAGTATVFPQAIGMAATFDEGMLERAGSIIADEARARHHRFSEEGDRDIYKGLTFWSPNINIFRDPRWGRGQETYGEDPYLTGRLAVAFIRGLQGPEGGRLKTAACAKHYVVHSGPEAKRHEFDVRVSAKDFRETYLSAFRDCVVEGGVEAVMGAYNRVDGEPCCGSRRLISGILREEFGFKGHFVSDCWAVADFHLHHRVTATPQESAALAVEAGCDLNCGHTYGYLLQAVREGLLSEDRIRESVERLMACRMRLGMFDPPEEQVYAGIPFELNDCRAHKDFALEVSRASLVLLKNRGGILPLDAEKIRTIAVVGPNADSIDALMGNYNGTSSENVTVLRGLRERCADRIRILYARGCELSADRTESLARSGDRLTEAVVAAKHADLVVLVTGKDKSIEGEAMDEGNADGLAIDGTDLESASLRLPEVQMRLLRSLKELGKPIVHLNLSGNPVYLDEAFEAADALIQAWYPGGEGGRAVAELLFGAYSPSGKLPVTFPSEKNLLPPFEDYDMRDRTYRYMTEAPLFPFGYGLSYTRFEFSDFLLDSDVLETGEGLAARVTVRNSGPAAGSEKVQIYLRARDCPFRTPNFQLIGIRSVFLERGASAELSFAVDRRRLSLIDEAGRRVLVPGSYELYVGGRQPDKRSAELAGTEVLCRAFRMDGPVLPIPY